MKRLILILFLQLAFSRSFSKEIGKTSVPQMPANECDNLCKKETETLFMGDRKLEDFIHPCEIGCRYFNIINYKNNNNMLLSVEECGYKCFTKYKPIKDGSLFCNIGCKTMAENGIRKLKLDEIINDIIILAKEDLPGADLSVLEHIITTTDLVTDVYKLTKLDGAKTVHTERRKALPMHNGFDLKSLPFWMIISVLAVALIVACYFFTSADRQPYTPNTSVASHPYYEINILKQDQQIQMSLAKCDLEDNNIPSSDPQLSLKNPPPYNESENIQKKI